MDCGSVEKSPRLAPKYDMADKEKAARRTVNMTRKCKMSDRADNKVSESVERGNENLKN
jgi:hypothetical protein